jgi:hypothetical protein
VPRSLFQTRSTSALWAVFISSSCCCCEPKKKQKEKKEALNLKLKNNENEKFAYHGLQICNQFGLWYFFGLFRNWRVVGWRWRVCSRGFVGISRWVGECWNRCCLQACIKVSIGFFFFCLRFVRIQHTFLVPNPCSSSSLDELPPLCWENDWVATLSRATWDREDCWRCEGWRGFCPDELFELRGDGWAGEANGTSLINGCRGDESGVYKLVSRRALQLSSWADQTSVFGSIWASITGFWVRNASNVIQVQNGPLISRPYHAFPTRCTGQTDESLVSSTTQSRRLWLSSSEISHFLLYRCGGTKDQEGGYSSHRCHQIQGAPIDPVCRWFPP